MPSPRRHPLYSRAHYLKGAETLRQCPPDAGFEVAFAGRSNAGKSSAINSLTGIGALARTSKTPGRTQMINFFTLDEERRLVDLPGYGFAKVPLEVKRRWDRLVEEYLSRRRCLRGLVLVMDVRHPLTPFDRGLLAWCADAAVAVHVLLTKADKLKRGAAGAALLAVRRDLADYPAAVDAQLFSALRATGVAELHRALDRWLEVGSGAVPGGQ